MTTILNADTDALSFGKLAKGLRKDSRSVKNRVQSIFHDSQHVKRVSESFELPLVANERCGRWYISPDDIAESVYFKSTDGHTNVHSFSTRRLNLHLLDFVKKHGGAVIVDSTRRGKPIPDALSKTIPQWCRVINLAVFGSQAPPLTTSPIIVGKSEHYEIEKKVDGWLEDFLRTGVDIEKLKKTLDKPVKPIWITPKDMLHDEPPKYTDFYPLVLCTASEMVQDGTDRRNGYIYVQGAADDHEEWAEKLTPALLWSHKQVLGDMNKSDTELLEYIDSLEDVKNTSEDSTVTIEPTGMSFGTSQKPESFAAIISVAKTAPTHPKVLHKPLGEGKKGAKELRTALEPISKFYKDFVGQKVLVMADEDDLAVCIVLTLFCLYFNENGTVKEGKGNMSKEVIRRRLVYMIQQCKTINPARATLNAVNSFLMG
ncbi:hypothetical protein CJU90_4577 [Yarrowia sp. C11]|nr:hypothetical protein CJU90_4577 [Yarrowia sp. C11]KAG5370523.1 hypothetical protein CKK34_0626 [Yarrowia sp. E02]